MALLWAIVISAKLLWFYLGAVVFILFQRKELIKHVLIAWYRFPKIVFVTFSEKEALGD